MYDFHSGALPPAFSNYFTAVNKPHKYNIRSKYMVSLEISQYTSTDDVIIKLGERPDVPIAKGEIDISHH